MYYDTPSPILNSNFNYLLMDDFSYSAVFLLIALLVVGAGAYSTLCSICMTANSGSIMMRPQYSQTITFLRERMSNCL